MSKMGRNNRNNTLLALVMRFINTIVLIIGYCVIIKELLSGTLTSTLIYYANMIVTSLTTIIQGT